MKIKEVMRRSCFVAVLALLCFVPGTFAQSRLTKPAITASMTSSVGTFIYDPIDWGNRNKKKVAAPEGGSASLYLLLAGLSCCAAMFVRSRRPTGSV